MLHIFWPSLSYHLSLRSLFCLFLSGPFRHILLYMKFGQKPRHLASMVVIHAYLKYDYAYAINITSKKTALYNIENIIIKKAVPMICIDYTAGIEKFSKLENMQKVFHEP